MPEKLVYVESPMIPLEMVSDELILKNILNPLTNKPYEGIILTGVFADLRPVRNNNNRVYAIEEYINMVEKLKQEIHGNQGVYGELEHPKRYDINLNYISHKIIDIWWDAEAKLVYGRVLLLDTEKGKIAQEVIKSGGKLAISARASGQEIPNSDGSKTAVVNLLTTYDLVYHPGFNSAILDVDSDINVLNEGFSGFITEKQLLNGDKILNESNYFYDNFNNKNRKCFLKFLLESTSKNEDISNEDEDKLKNLESSTDNEKEEDLKKATEVELKESKNIALEKLIQSMNKNQKKQYLNIKKAYFDGSAGFENNIIQNKNLNEMNALSYYLIDTINQEDETLMESQQFYSDEDLFEDELGDDEDLFEDELGDDEDLFEDELVDDFLFENELGDDEDLFEDELGDDEYLFEAKQKRQQAQQAQQKRQQAQQAQQKRQQAQQAQQKRQQAQQKVQQKQKELKQAQQELLQTQRRKSC